jgi:hypothetical protein
VSLWHLQDGIIWAPKWDRQFWRKWAPKWDRQRHWERAPKWDRQRHWERAPKWDRHSLSESLPRFKLSFCSSFVNLNCCEKFFMNSIYFNWNSIMKLNADASVAHWPMSVPLRGSFSVSLSVPLRGSFSVSLSVPVRGSFSSKLSVPLRGSDDAIVQMSQTHNNLRGYVRKTRVYTFFKFSERLNIEFKRKLYSESNFQPLITLFFIFENCYSISQCDT